MFLGPLNSHLELFIKPDHECNKSVNCFCYICGNYTLDRNKKTFSEKLQKFYEEYFEISYVNEKSKWAPTIVCSS